MYKKKEFNLDQYYNDHHYTGIMGFLMRYCHKNLEKFLSLTIKAVFSDSETTLENSTVNELAITFS